MQRSTLIPHQAGLFFSASRPYNNAVILIYIWGTVMVDITKQNWQNIPIVLWKGRLSPTLTLREKKKERKEKAFLSFGFTSEWEFNFSPLHSVVIYHPWRSGPGPQEVKRKCNRKRRRWTVWSPACKSSFFFYESRPPWKMKCSCCERKQRSGTHVITLTPRRGSAGIHPQATAPMCPLGLKPTPLTPENP